MSLIKRVRAMGKQILLGDPPLPQEFTIGLIEPQTEVAVWLHGMGAPLDVTWRLTTACCAPLMVCVGLDKTVIDTTEVDHGKADLRASLKFTERGGHQRLLGETRLDHGEVLKAGEARFVLFHVCGSTNHCLPKPRLWALYAAHAYHQWRWVKNPDVKMTQVEQRAAMVTFIRPHPLVLVSLQGAEGGNIFPMNLMGELGHGYFGFALKVTRMASQLVERTRRLALSSVPLEQSALAYSYAVHHTRASIDWDALPFSLRLSQRFLIPIPEFALRVRELEVERVIKTGSHTFFLARIVSDERLSEGLQVNVIHGFYQALRLKGQTARLAESIAQDSINKKGVPAGHKRDFAPNPQ